MNTPFDVKLVGNILKYPPLHDRFWGSMDDFNKESGNQLYQVYINT